MTRPGEIISITQAPQYLRTLDAARDLHQFEDGVRVGFDGDPVVDGLVLHDQLSGDTAVATQPLSQRVAMPPRWCKFDVTTGARVSAWGTNGCREGPYSYFSSIGIAQVPDGYRAIVQKSCSNGCPAEQESFGLVRLSPDGQLDATFGTDMGIAYSTVLPEVRAIAFAAQSTGRLIVNGYVGLYAMKLFRIHPDGSLDTTFGTDGFAVGANGARVRVLADDSILLEASYNGIERIERYTKDGAPLPGWGTDGRADLEELTDSTFDNELNSTAADLDADGRMVVGYSRTDEDDGPEHHYVLRLTASGALDTTFGTGGIAQLPAEVTWVNGIGHDAAGQIVVGVDTREGTRLIRIAP